MVYLVDVANVRHARERKRKAAMMRDKEEIEQLRCKVVEMEWKLFEWQAWYQSSYVHSSRWRWHPNTDPMEPTSPWCEGMRHQQQDKLHQFGQPTAEKCGLSMSRTPGIDYSRWDRLVVSSEGEKENEKVGDGYWGAESEEEEEKEAEYEEEDEEVAEEYFGGTREEHDGRVAGPHVGQYAMGTEDSSGAAQEDDYDGFGELSLINQDHVHNKRCIMDLLTASKRIIDEAFEEVEAKFATNGPLLGKLCAARQQQQHQHDGFMEMVTKLQDTEFRQPGAMQVRSLIMDFREDMLLQLQSICEGCRL